MNNLEADLVASIDGNRTIHNSLSQSELESNGFEEVVHTP